MALVRQLGKTTIEHASRHTEASATYSIVMGDDGTRMLQIDTYGSSSRLLLGKKSQSIRFAPEAADQLRKILDKEL